jgi:hypothetical protein
VESGAVQDTAVANVDKLEPIVVDWDELEMDAEACRELLLSIADLPDTENITAVRNRLNNYIEEDEESEDIDNDGALEEDMKYEREDDYDDDCCEDCGEYDCDGSCVDEDEEEHCERCGGFICDGSCGDKEDELTLPD